MVILHLRAEVVQHVVNVSLITILVLKELGHIVNLVSVQSLSSCNIDHAEKLLQLFVFLTFTGETHGNYICEDISQVQVITINLGRILLETNRCRFILIFSSQTILFKKCMPIQIISGNIDHRFLSFSPFCDI